MEIKINIEKKYFFVLLFVFLVVGGVLIVKAFGTNNPQQFGHSFSEIADPVSDGKIYGGTKNNGGKQLLITVNKGQGGINDEIWIGPNIVAADGTIVLSAITTDIANNAKIGGRLGIGGINPSATLDVNGDARVRGNLEVDGRLIGPGRYDDGGGSRTVCFDHYGAIVYEKSGTIGRLYIAGISFSGFLGGGCGGDPGKWNENAGKVKFLEWDWSKTIDKRIIVQTDAVQVGPITYTESTPDGQVKRGGVIDPNGGASNHAVGLSYRWEGLDYLYKA